jgi:hypothetical protein
MMSRRTDDCDSSLTFSSKNTVHGLRIWTNVRAWDTKSQYQRYIYDALPEARTQQNAVQLRRLIYSNKWTHIDSEVGANRESEVFEYSAF